MKRPIALRLRRSALLAHSINIPDFAIMQARLRSVKGLVRSAQCMMRSKPSVRLFATSSTPASAVYEHMSNMKTQDLFQFEPFNDADLVVS